MKMQNAKNLAQQAFEAAEEVTAVPPADKGAMARPDGLPDGFRVRPGGIERREDRSDGEAEWVWLCSALRVLALTRDREGRDWGRLVEIIDRDGRAHIWALPAELFAGDGRELRAEALRLGLNLASGSRARTAFSDLLMQWRPTARALTADRLGWADETCSAFVLGDGRVLGASDVVYQAAQSADAARAMRAAGSIEDWRVNVAAACIGNPLLVACVSLALAGPLLEPLGLEGGGVHLRGASSRGKSTALRVGTSVWGGPRFANTWRATDNGLEGLGAVCNGTLLALDEMGEVNGKAAGAAAYMLANGQGKTRAGRTGAARAPVRWRVMILSTGEIRLADKMAEAGMQAAAGQEVRLLDIAADTRAHGAFDVLHGASSAAAFAERLNRAAATHYGTAGPAFVEALLAEGDAGIAAIRAALANFSAEARHRFGLSHEGQVARVVNRLALVAAAGETATAFDLTGWPQGEAANAALVLLELWLEGRGGGGPAEADAAIARTREFLVKHGPARFEIVRSVESVAVRDRAGWRDNEYFYVAPDVWRREVHQGADHVRAARHLRAAGHLVPGDGSNLTVRLPATTHAARPRAYCIKAAIMGAGND